MIVFLTDIAVQVIGGIIAGLVLHTLKRRHEKTA